MVILGAGADSRAHRFAEGMRGVTVFEFDHPLTSQWKQARVLKLFGRPPEHVRYVPIDLSRDTLDGALAVIGTAEPILFLPRTLAAHGLAMASDVRGPELSARHLAGRADVIPISAIAHARCA